MAENTVNNTTVNDPVRLIKEVNIIKNDGTPAFNNVAIAPDADKVMIFNPAAEKPLIPKASLQEFLFSKFKAQTVEIDTDGDNIKEVIRVRATDENGNLLYFDVDPSSKSVWQSWYDYQDMNKKRLVGLYKKTAAGTYEYQAADFLLGQETDIQAQYTLETAEPNVPSNIAALITHYGLADKDGDVDYIIPVGTNEIYKEDGNIKDITWDSETDPKVGTIGTQSIDRYTPEEKAKEKMLAFGETSFWQALIDYIDEERNRMIGIYDNQGNCVGHFEATRYNLDQLKEVYDQQYTVAINDVSGEITHEVTWGAVKTDKDAMDIIVDLSKKSVYQQLLELKDFWITLPFENFDVANDDIKGLNIANINDFAELHLNPEHSEGGGRYAYK